MPNTMYRNSGSSFINVSKYLGVSEGYVYIHAGFPPMVVVNFKIIL